MMLPLCLAIFVAKNLAEASPLDRYSQDAEAYCMRHAKHYRAFCTAVDPEMDRDLFSKILKFCPVYEKNCGSAMKIRRDMPLAPAADLLIVPPALPLKSTDFLRFEQPSITSVEKPVSVEVAGRMEAAVIASCTPDCTAAHCTDLCKCKNTHPKVHAVCNPPANAEMAATCQRWYQKCPMFQPVSY